MQQESLCCPAVVSRDHEVCLAAKHAKREESPSSHKLVDTDAEGAVLFSLREFTSSDRSTVAV